MTDPRPTALAEHELHAFVDGRLAPDEAQAFEARMAREPALAATVRALLAQRETLRGHLAAVADEPVPDTLLQAALARPGAQAPSPGRWWRWGGFAASVLLAFAAGWMAQMQMPQRGLGLAAGARPAGEFARQALVAHAVYAPEVRHPVEVDATQQDHLVQWLSRRLGRPLRIPRLSEQGFELVGGRLLPGTQGARAQFMYQNAGGERVTLYAGSVPGDPAATAFRFEREGAASTFYWVDQGFGYALAGDLPRPRLLQLAESVYRQL
ncbi:MAG TPA: anti-sigma factor [Ramlibacter sp.]|nr:anti-sigma factor [Ramlibacter sp.]